MRNWVKAAAEGKLSGASGRVVTPEEMELSRLERRLGEDLKRPKGMHRETYTTLVARHRAAVEARNGVLRAAE